MPPVTQPLALSRPQAIDPRRTDPWTRALLDVVGRIRVGQCLIVLPDGAARLVDGDAERHLRGVIVLKSARAARRLLLGGSIGFAEAYIDGDWDTPDLVGLLEVALRNEPVLEAEVTGSVFVRALHALIHRLRANTRRGSRRNIAAHYDLSNDFYRLWLDPEMTYSSALYRDPSDDLVSAQANKYRQLIDMLGLRPEHHLLEIGCGWGTFALLCAREIGCRVTAITLSAAQHAYAAARVAEAGLDDLVEIRLQDYRDVEGRFDRIASIEMFEAVGEAYWPNYFRVLRRCLKAGGCAALQVITIEDDRFGRYRRGPDFIQRYIFPGGMLPCPAAFGREASRAGLRITAEASFGASYARTLNEWQRRFQHQWDEIRSLGFESRFRRLWEYYLAYCEAGFRVRSIDVTQYRLEPVAERPE